MLFLDLLEFYLFGRKRDSICIDKGERRRRKTREKD